MTTRDENARAEKGEWDFKARENMVQTTVLEKIGLGLVMGSLPALAAAKVPEWVLSDSNKSLSKYLQVELGKFVGRHTNINQLRMLVPPQPLRRLLESPVLSRVSEGVNDYNKLFPVDNSSARWIKQVPGRQRSDPVLLYLHGGAYMITTMPPQVSWMLKFAQRTQDIRMSVLEVDYTVSPNARWPQQREEALAVYRELQKTCDKIILLGDSAGGHLALNMCDELHAHGLPPPFGVVLVSPWADLVPRKSGSYVTNARHDYIEIDHYPGLLFATKDQLEDPQVNPCRGDHAYWEGKLGPNSCCVWGEHEVLADCCAEISAKCGIHETFVQPKGLHDALILNPKSTSSDFVEACVRRWIAPTRGVPPIPADAKL